MNDKMQPTMTEAEVAAWMKRIKAPTGPARKYRKPPEWQNMTVSPKHALRRSQKPVAPVTAGGCTHHWILESPDGPECLGTCKLCGETRTYALIQARSMGSLMATSNTRCRARPRLRQITRCP